MSSFLEIVDCYSVFLSDSIVALFSIFLTCEGCFRGEYIIIIVINHSIGAVGVSGDEGYGVVSLESACSHLGLQGVPDPLDLVMYECTETRECTIVVKLVWRSVLTY